MGALWKAPFREKSCLMGKRLSLPDSQSKQGAFHLSELTGQLIPIVMGISLLINNNHPDQSNPTHYAQRRWFFSKSSWKRPVSFPKCLVWPWSGRPVLTYGNRRQVMFTLHRDGFSWRHRKLSVIVWTSIRYLTLLFRDRRGAASLRHRNRATTVLVCEQKRHPVWFSWRPV